MLRQPPKPRTSQIIDPALHEKFVQPQSFFIGANTWLMPKRTAG